MLPVLLEGTVLRHLYRLVLLRAARGAVSSSPGGDRPRVRRSEGEWVGVMRGGGVRNEEWGHIYKAQIRVGDMYV